MIKIGINGFNETGRNLVRLAAQSPGDMGIVQINEPFADTTYMAYQLRYSSNYGRFPGRISEESGVLTVGNSKIRVTDCVKTEQADWQDCDVVINCDKNNVNTESFVNAKRIIMPYTCNSAPMVDYRLNHSDLRGERVLAQASPETSAIAVVGKIINNCFGIENAIATTLSAVDGESVTADGKNSERWRNGRCGDSIIPALCGGANGAGILVPELSGRISGIALHVPVKKVSVLNFVCKLKGKTDYSEVSEKLKNASEGEYGSIFGVTDECVVSCDFSGCPLSAVADIRAGLLQDGNLLKITAWYDGIWNYPSKLIKLAEFICS